MTVYRSMDLSWEHVWLRTAEQLGEYLRAGYSHLLTEDTLRLSAINALVEGGVVPGEMTVEWPTVGRGRLDLFVETDAFAAAIEFKFPRDARGPISPDTMTHGQLIGDFFRVSQVRATTGWVVQLVNRRLLAYLKRRTPSWVADPGSSYVLRGAEVLRLPKTAREQAGPWGPDHEVSAHCACASELPDGLTLLTYCVPTLAYEAPAQSVTRLDHAPGTPRSVREYTARQVLLSAAVRLHRKGGRMEFAKRELLEEASRLQTGHTMATLDMALSQHLCVARGEARWGYDDFNRVSRGIYRLRRHPSDLPSELLEANIA